MIKLEIIVQPKSNKYLEFSQSLKFIKSDLMKFCTSLSIDEKNKTFSIIADLVSAEQLVNILYSKELSVLSGAIRILGEKSEIFIQNNGQKNKGSDLREIRLNYSRTKKEKINH